MHQSTEIHSPAWPNRRKRAVKIEVATAKRSGARVRARDRYSRCAPCGQRRVAAAAGSTCCCRAARGRTRCNGTPPSPEPPHAKPTPQFRQRWPPIHQGYSFACKSLDSNRKPQADDTKDMKSRRQQACLRESGGKAHGLAASGERRLDRARQSLLVLERRGQDLEIFPGKTRI